MLSWAEWVQKGSLSWLAIDAHCLLRAQPTCPQCTHMWPYICLVSSHLPSFGWLEFNTATQDLKCECLLRLNQILLHFLHIMQSYKQDNKNRTNRRLKSLHYCSLIPPPNKLPYLQVEISSDKCQAHCLNPLKQNNFCDACIVMPRSPSGPGRISSLNTLLWQHKRTQ